MTQQFPLFLQLIRSAEPVQILLKKNTDFPMIPQYPVSHENRKGVISVIQFKSRLDRDIIPANMPGEPTVGSSGCVAKKKGPQQFCPLIVQEQFYFTGPLSQLTVGNQKTGISMGLPHSSPTLTPCCLDVMLFIISKCHTGKYDYCGLFLSFRASGSIVQ